MGDEGDEGDEGEITNAQCSMPNAQCPMPNAQYFDFAQYKCPMTKL
ncbi:hypothetical protein [Nostoc sp.]